LNVANPAVAARGPGSHPPDNILSFLDFDPGNINVNEFQQYFPDDRETAAVLECQPLDEIIANSLSAVNEDD
jgi:hypothetical protein